MTVLWKKLSPYIRKGALDAYSRSYTEIADVILCGMDPGRAIRLFVHNLPTAA